MDTPVLFLVFNRPDSTQSVMEVIRRARPRRLYVASDGPRADRPNEAARVGETRAIATAVDWDCEVTTLFRDGNLGCKRAVSGALDWFFSQEPEGIVLEDDIVPAPGFFPFCAELLERYRNDPRVGMIGGFNPLRTDDLTRDSYLFSNYPAIWGWASWARAWNGYQVDLESWREPSAMAVLSDVLDGRSAAADYWRDNLDAVADGRIDTWDYQLLWHGWRHRRVAIVPATSLCDNIGFGADATHTTGAKPGRLVRLSVGSLSFPLRHPVDLAINARFDRRLENQWYQLALPFRARRRVARAVRAVQRWWQA